MPEAGEPPEGLGFSGHPPTPPPRGWRSRGGGGWNEILLAAGREAEKRGFWGLSRGGQTAAVGSPRTKQATLENNVSLYC